MPDCQVTCIRKPNRFSSHEHITHIGNSSGNWFMTREVAIKRIEGKIDTFFVVDPANGKRSNVEVVKEANKDPYLRTRADGDLNDNLLSLNECSSGLKEFN